MPSKQNKPRKEVSFDDDVSSLDWGERYFRLYFESKRMLAAWWWLLLLAVCGGVGWQAYQELNRDPVYVSEAEMIVSGRFSLPDSVYREELSNFFGTQMTLMRSQRVREMAHERVATLHPDIQRGWVRLTVEQRQQASIFRLRVEGEEAEYVRAYLDAIMEEYQNFRREMRSETSESTLLAVTQQLTRLEEEIDRQEEAVVDFQKANNLVFLKEQDTSTGSHLAGLTNQQAELKNQLLILENLGMDEVAEWEGSVSSNGNVSSLVGANNIEAYNDALARAAKLKAERDEFSVYLKPRHPKIIDLEMDLERTRNLIEVLERQALASLDDRRNLLRRQIRNLDPVISQWESIALDISRKSAEFERLNYRLNRSRGTYQRLLDSVQAIESNQQLEQETVGVLENASVAVSVSPSVGRKMAEGAAGGLLGGIFILMGIALFDVRVRTSEDLLKRFDFPMLGVIPEETRNKGGKVDLLDVKDPRRRFFEACRSVRSALYLQELENKEKTPQCFVVTSSIPGEGKSTITANLGVVFALADKRVLLVDADFRKGEMRKIFSLEKMKGLSDGLRDGEPFENIVCSTGIENLDFVGHGKTVETPGEWLLDGKIDEFIEWAKERYDFIFFDSPPLLAVDDALGLAGKIDSILFVVRANLVSGKQVQTSLDRLDSRVSKVSGFVFNCAEVGGLDYYYYYKNYDSYYS